MLGGARTVTGSPQPVDPELEQIFSERSKRGTGPSPQVDRSESRGRSSSCFRTPQIDDSDLIDLVLFSLPKLTPRNTSSYSSVTLDPSGFVIKSGSVTTQQESRLFFKKLQAELGEMPSNGRANLLVTWSLSEQNQPGSFLLTKSTHPLQVLEETEGEEASESQG